MSRVTELTGIRVFSPNSTPSDQINNIVYRELLDGQRPSYTKPSTSAPVPLITPYDPLPDEFVFET